MRFPQLLHRSDSADTLGRAGQLPRLVAIVVIIVGILDSLLIGYQEAKRPGVFWTREQVGMIYPQLDQSNGMQYISPSMIVMAGVIEKMIEPDPHPRLATAEATLVGTGVRDGFSVTLPNTGGQWANQFVSPYLDVQVVAPTLAAAQQRTDQLVAEIKRDLQTLQDESAVPAKYRVTAALSPPAPVPIYYQKGSAKRALLAALALGLAITFTAAGLLRRGLAGYAARRRAASRPAAALA